MKTFAELRGMADEGQIQYPYSTREVVNIVKHLEVSSSRAGQHSQAFRGEFQTSSWANQHSGEFQQSWST